MKIKINVLDEECFVIEKSEEIQLTSVIFEKKDGTQYLITADEVAGNIKIMKIAGGNTIIKIIPEVSNVVRIQ